MEELVEEFLIESREMLDELDEAFVELERAPDDTATLAGIFRSIHTIKGTCGFLGFGNLESLTHVGENLLAKLRDGELVVTAAITTALLQMLDAVRGMLASIEDKGNEEGLEAPELIAQLRALQEPDAAPQIAPEAATEATPEATAEVTGVAEPVVEAVAEPDAAPETPTDTASPPSATPHEPQAKAAQTPPPTKPGSSPAPAANGPPAGRKGRGGKASDGVLRVQVELLDHVMNLVGELVLARNQLLEHVKGAAPALIASTQRLDRVTSELQEGVMRTRMQPIGNVWTKFPRVIRDLALACGKKVRIELEGKETELDKTLLEAIKDPLTHLLRNSVDHGIEPPDVRRAVGKPEEGVVRLRAYHEGGQVNIEFVDDGGGISPDRVRQKAIEKGLIDPEQAARLTDRDAVNLLFLPGFSTAEKVTNVSGRGVGMDVVKTNIESIGGSLELNSKYGQSTTVRLTIPLTLAIIPALMVSCMDERYAIPQTALVELIRSDPELRNNEIQYVQGTYVYRLRDSLLPLIFLRQELDPDYQIDGTVLTEGHEDVSIVVVHNEGRTFGVVVDEIHDTQEIVVKPLGVEISALPLYAGATVMGDGSVSLILDVGRMAERVGLTADETCDGDGDSAAVVGNQESDFLLVRKTGGDQVALRLAAVGRLEAFRLKVIESVDGRPVAQYFGSVMPLFDLEEMADGVPIWHAGAAEESPDLDQHVIVVERGGKRLGLIVKEIVDIVHGAEIGVADGSSDVTEVTLVDGHVTKLLDIEALFMGAGIALDGLDPDVDGDAMLEEYAA